MNLDADVVIVGSGAGAGVVAKAVAEAGRSVVVLEAGPFVPEPEMPRNELDAFDRLYLGHGLTATWDGSISILAGTGVGGGTTVNWMTSIVAPTRVRADWAIGHGLSGFDGAEGDADFAAVSAELGVTNVAHPPAKDAAILRGAAELGIEAGPIPRNAGACTACGSCTFGCRAGTKRSGLRVHLAAAFEAGAMIVPESRVDRILVEDGRANGVEATLDWEPRIPASEGVPERAPRRLVVRARQVVVAAGALRTPVVLERSGLEHPGLGRNLRLHPVAVLAGWYPEPIDMWRGTAQGARSLEFLQPGPGRRGYAIESAPGHPGLLALALPWEGTDRHAAIMERIRRCGPLIAVSEDGGSGRVRATTGGGARIDYALDAEGIATLRHALGSMARLARAAGARELVAVGTPPAWHGATGFPPGGEAGAFARFLEEVARFDYRPNRGTVFSAHQMGTVRMGADPASHPCDPEGRFRRVDGGRTTAVAGLYVADASLFPTGIGVNPMLTVMALARRVARTVLAEG